MSEKRGGLVIEDDDLDGKDGDKFGDSDSLDIEDT